MAQRQIELTKDQTQQARRILRALGTAHASIDAMTDKEAHDNRITERDRVCAKASLSDSLRMLSAPHSKKFDLPTHSISFLGHLNKEDRAKTKAMLAEKGLDTLSLFGARRLDLLKSAFASIGLPVPLALARFHTAYQAELQLIASIPPRNRNESSADSFAKTVPISIYASE